jgi:hypothetical protein
MAMLQFRSSLFATFVFALALAQAACSTENGLAYRTLTVQALTAGTPTVTHCTTLPQLIGSEIDDHVPLADGVTAHVVAKRDEAALSFTGTVGAEADSRTITEVELSSDFSERFSVISSSSQASFDISLASGCPKGS